MPQSQNNGSRKGSTSARQFCDFTSKKVSQRRCFSLSRNEIVLASDATAPGMDAELNRIRSVHSMQSWQNNSVAVRSVSTRKPKSSESACRHAFWNDHPLAVSVSLPQIGKRIDEFSFGPEARFGRTRIPLLLLHRGSGNGGS